MRLPQHPNTLSGRSSDGTKPRPNETEHVRPNPQRFRPKLGRCRRNLAGISQIWQISEKNGRVRAKIGQIKSKLNQLNARFPKAVKIWLKLGICWPTSTNFGRARPKLVEIWQTLIGIGQNMVEFGPKLAKPILSLTEFSLHLVPSRPKSPQLGPTQSERNFDRIRPGLDSPATTPRHGWGPAPHRHGNRWRLRRRKPRPPSPHLGGTPPTIQATAGATRGAARRCPRRRGTGAKRPRESPRLTWCGDP